MSRPEALYDPEHVLRLLANSTPDEQATLLASLTEEQRDELVDRWWAWAHDGQFWPRHDWRIWLICAGRGFGKTRAGAEWISTLARARPQGRFALVGATIGDVRRVMIEGASGLLAVARPDEKVAWVPSNNEVVFASGARAFAYSAETPDMLRGPEHDAAWCDELAKWRRGADAWDNLLLTLRIGKAPRALVTTTPRPTALMRRVIADAAADDAYMQGRTRDNPHLPPSFVAAMLTQFGAMRIGRQELDGEVVDEAEGALWTRALLEACRVAVVPDVVRVVVGVDPPAGTEGDACGIVAVAQGADGHGYVLEDASVAGAAPETWARAVADCAARWGADRVVAEANQGGAMVEAVLRAADTGLPVTPVHASRGKVARAEPVSVRYRAGRVHHVGAFAALEDELCGLLSGGRYVGPGRSPDRADALVWAMAEVMAMRAAPGVAVL